MKNLPLIIAGFFLIVATSNQSFAQKKPLKAKPVVLKRYHLPDDKDGSNKVTLAQALAWADTVPLTVVGTDKKVVFLHQYELSIIIMKPLQIKEYGTGNDGIPLMARKEMDGLKAGDTVFFKDVTAKDEKGNEVKIANVIFSIKE